MIVYDLRCAAAHVFEAWFDGAAAYDDQRARGLVECPLCGDGSIEKAVSAPRIGRGDSGPTPAQVKTMLTEMAGIQARVEASCDYVGDAFPAEARAMHHGETEQRGIYGEATAAQAIALRDEGIAVAALPFRPRARADA